MRRFGEDEADTEFKEGEVFIEIVTSTLRDARRASTWSNPSNR